MEQILKDCFWCTNTYNGAEHDRCPECLVKEETIPTVVARRPAAVPASN